MIRKLRRFAKVVNKPYKDEFYHYPGTIPGTIIIDADAPPPEIDLIDYNQTDFVHRRVATPEECVPYLDTESVTWVDVQGLGNQDILERVGQIFELPPLVLEDVVNVSERPKTEDYDDQLLFIARMVVPKERESGFYSEQVSLVLGKHYLLSIQEEPEHDCFEGVRMRIEKGKGNIRRQRADYLAYALLDAIIDGFFPVLERYGEALEDLEEEVIVSPTRQTLQKIYQVRRELLQLRRAIWPQRDAINSLIRDRSQLISPEVQIYLRDCYDHTVQVMDMVETYRELASGLMDVYLSAVGNKMNEVMKLLTVVSSIFIPLTFVAGIYGMNFNTEKSPYNMPELNWYWGYPLCLGVMGAIAFALLFLFWKRGWLENSSMIERD
ncbi:Magnesium and cobalt transport protein CorA [Trichormus variabilis ATCC 29413]|uniref:Magnesium transport protein CorA n=2 Tax=Anabaena variabilis TaxID=264691 RepID=Q3MF17_TRIV2|nr:MULTISPECIES: magnesium/cobalt transporter CorA [Nostocaceae]ABA20419.1 Magnesium and cobalt transport protein CorA [Trichormus variabilis ATCC 29413]MBC1212602.1 magnesium/cobalt transporter CorA [Trichormus variabilis ARAD]MBC1255198.1 magnesium/cobalt transporter CorA [Trichormus variabilis V5]MBC1265554.1 magnesium/cobalt transporter CorA [Trichormus variabilis FSR]MBC1300514.1 magnesium/cobalt transporter CorA [Trichormus variabilis N2B]